jgi:hypothetical protein
MIRSSIVISACVLSLSFDSAARAQTSEVDSTQTRSSVINGVVQTVTDHTLTVRDPSGIHSYTVRDGFKFRNGEQELGIDELKPGMPITADITDEVTTRDVTITQRVDGTVMQVTPGGFVLLDPRKQYVSYDFQDAQRKDYHYVTIGGQELSLRDVKVGDHLQGQMVTRFPPEVIDERIVQLDVTTPGLASTPAASSSGTGGSGASK